MNLINLIKKSPFIDKFLDIILKIMNFINSNYNINILNRLINLLSSFKASIVFLIEGQNWVVDWIMGFYSSGLNNLGLIKSSIITNRFVKNKILHFGSIYLLFTSKGLIKLNKSNKHVVTYFHVVPNDKILKYLPILGKKIDILHTPSPITKKTLIKLGFPENKIVVVPMGVDLSIFKLYNDKKKSQLKKSFNLPEDKIIIGSFQKDGVGWGEGLQPKFVKGPDVFCKVVKKIYEKFDIHIFLVGPARGYVKKKLEEYHIPYSHIIQNYLNMADCYNVLDLYIVASRVEGGPMAFLECMATGVPLITTQVGMAPYLIKNGVNGFVTDIEDINKLFYYSMKILQNNNLRNSLIKNGFKTAQLNTWESATKHMYQKIYKRLLE